MGDRMECPACENDLWRILQAYEAGEPCPECGLPADAAREILDARKRGADELLERKYTEALSRAMKAEGEAGELRERLKQIREFANRPL